MAKLPFQQVIAPVDGTDVVTKAYGDATYSGGTPLSVQGAYLRAGKTANQDNPVTDDAVEWDNLHASRGDAISLNVTNGQVTLKAGRTYYVHADVWCEYSSAFLAQFEWYDVTGAAAVPGSVSTNRSTTASAQWSSLPSSTMVVAPLVDSIYELRLTAESTSGVDIKGTVTGAQALASSLEIFEIGATVASVIGGLEYMDTIEVSGDTTSVTFGAGGDGVTGRALDGDVDEAYVLEYWFPAATTSVNINLKPNGVGTDQRGASDYGGQSAGGLEFTSMPLTSTASGRMTGGVAEFQAKSGKDRALQANTVETDAAAQTWSIKYAGHWGDDSTNITSLEIEASVASQLKSGARFVLWRRTSDNVRADSASTYERNVEAVVDQGTNSEVEYTTGHATYQGSAIGVSVSLNDTVTAGSITVNLKVDGATVLTATLDTTDTTFARALAIIGAHAVTSGDEIIVGISTTGLTTTGGGSPGITVNTTLVNDALIASTAGLLDSANTYTKAQTVSPSALTWGANIAVDASLSNVFTVTLTGATAQLDNPTNLEAGQTIVIMVTQDPTGGRALTFDTNWDFGGDGAPDLTAEAGDALSLISGITDGTKIFVSSKLGFVA